MAFKQPLKRVSNWVALCNWYIEVAKDKPFSWGDLDCCLFAADLVYCQTNYDPAAEYRSHYSTRIGSIRALKKYGARTSNLTETWTYLLGIKPTYSIAASRGDVCLIEQSSPHAQDQLIVGICWGTEVLAVSDSGLIRVSLGRIKCFWHLECRT